MAIAENLRAEMERAQVTQYALERLSGVPQPTIQRILKGSDPKASTINKLAAALKINASILLSNDPVIEEQNPGYKSKKEATNHTSPSALLAKLKGRITPRSKALLETLAEIDATTGLSEPDIRILEAVIARYETKGTGNNTN